MRGDPIMRYVLAFVLVLSMVGAAAAYDLGNALQEKTDVYPDYVNPDVRQGGDTIADATVIPGIPYNITGTTAGYNNDYDEACPYTISTSPDVVYTLTLGSDLAVAVDLCGSLYDTKTYVYDVDLNLIACNDDFYFDDECGMYVSFLEFQAAGGMEYFIIIDGYGGDFGDYLLEVREGEGPCDLQCPAEGVDEGEPELVDDYEDLYNGGCNSPPTEPFQDLNVFGQTDLTFCGIAGWYVFEGANYRDTDWFIATVGENGFIIVTVDAQSATNIFELGGSLPACDAVTVDQSMTVGPCAPGEITIFAAPMEVVFLWAGSANFANPGDVPGNEYLYVMDISGLHTATESSTWSQVKGLYR
jgi:hypothetical protein